MPRQGADSPMLWNKRAVRSVELAFGFTVHDQTGGWRLAVTEAGSVEVRFADGGGQETVPVAVGDRLVSTGDDLFLLRGAGAAPSGPGPSPDAGPGPAKPAKGGGGK